MKVEATLHGDRKVYSVSAFNRGIGSWLARLPTLWVEGEVTELRRQSGWQSVFLTLKDLEDGSCLPVSMPRTTFDALRLDLADGDRVHVYGRPELYEARGVFQLRGALAGAARARCRARAHRAAEEVARRRGALRRRAQAPAARASRAYRAPHRQRGRCEARLPHCGGRPLPRRPHPRRGDARAGREGAGCDRRHARGALPRAGGRRRRGRPGRRQLRGPPPLQRRAGRAGRRRVPRARRLGGRTRAGHAALRPCRRRPRVDADRRGPPRRPRRAPAPRRPRPPARGARPRHATYRRARPAFAGGRRPAPHPRAGALPGAQAGSARRARRQAPDALPACDAASAATRSSGRNAGSSAPRARSRLGTRIDVELAEGGLGARVEETRE